MPRSRSSLCEVVPASVALLSPIFSAMRLSVREAAGDADPEPAAGAAERDGHPNVESTHARAARAEDILGAC